MSETEITDAPQQAAVDPVVAEILRLYGHIVESVTVSVVRGELRRETKVQFTSPDAEALGFGQQNFEAARMLRNMKPLVR